MKEPQPPSPKVNLPRKATPGLFKLANRMDRSPRLRQLMNLATAETLAKMPALK